MPHTNDFIAALPSFTRFAQAADPDRYTPAPDNWRVYCCDVVNSTGAIAEGRYRAVNMIGAACVIAAINAASGVEIAFVFGGDGATLLVPGAVAPAVDRALLRTRRLARDGFGLGLRLGAVPVPEIRARGADIAVAMFELSPGNRTAMFSGGGAALADRLVKGDAAGRFGLGEADDEPPDLDGLSCRWEPLATLHGHMLCLLAAAVPEAARERARIYGDLLAAVERVLWPGIETARPVQADNMRFRWPPRGLGLEIVATRGRKPRWRQAIALGLQSFLQAIAEWFDRRIGDYHAPVYRAELRANSDYRRFDDVLRLVLDCTEAQRTAIETILAAGHARGDIVYGTHRSDAAVMTCLLFDLRDSRHLHFVDGSDGGFTLAARAMKVQIAAVSGQRRAT
ncbi:MAG: DUF3095 domain-containing protein [Rhodospirillales bacterium]